MALSPLHEVPEGDGPDRLRRWHAGRFGVAIDATHHRDGIGIRRSYPEPGEPGDVHVAGLFIGVRNAGERYDLVVKFQTGLDVLPLASRVITFQ